MGAQSTKYYFYVPLVLILFLAMIVFIVVMTNRPNGRIPVQYAKRVVGRKMYGGQSTFIPIKVNMTGVMPIIFASSLLAIPGTIKAFVPLNTEGLLYKFLSIFNYNTGWYAMIYILLIIVFNYFYVAIQYNPVEIANNLQKNNGAIPGIRPGKPTTEFITKVISKITLVGALFLGPGCDPPDSVRRHHWHEHFAGRYFHSDCRRRCAGYDASAGIPDDDAPL